jgi:hypothetical protein
MNVNTEIHVKNLIEATNDVNFIKDILSRKVFKVARRYIDAYDSTNRGYGYPSLEADFHSWEIDAEGEITVEWNEYWAHGGHDEGIIYYPSSYLYDEQSLLDYENKRKIEKLNAAEDKKNKQREIDEEHYNKLKENSQPSVGSIPT